MGTRCWKCGAAPIAMLKRWVIQDAGDARAVLICRACIVASDIVARSYAVEIESDPDPALGRPDNPYDFE